MIQSMTGFGKAQLELSNSNVNIELKSLNSKHLDLNIKLPKAYKHQELELKKYLTNKLYRGKIEISILLDDFTSESEYSINVPKLKEYHKQILDLKNELNLKNNTSNHDKLEKSDIISILLNMPEAFHKKENEIQTDNWADIFQGVESAVESLVLFRKKEGENLLKDISDRIALIDNFLKEIVPLSEFRIEKIKSNLKDKIENAELQIDPNRFEQELIYYLEKQDITEEIVRLQSHLNYFLETTKTDSPNGKKLGFICQEIGREINTIGSKASNAEMQKIVVNMKNELEKIKEQLLNIL